jgi:hypothetical protein
MVVSVLVMIMVDVRPMYGPYGDKICRISAAV